MPIAELARDPILLDPCDAGEFVDEPL